MADLNIRNVDDELVRRLKVAALDGGLTLREYVIWRLGGMENGGSHPVARPAEGEERPAVRGEGKRKGGNGKETAALGREVDRHQARKDVGHGTLCMCRECETKRRGK